VYGAGTQAVASRGPLVHRRHLPSWKRVRVLVDSNRVLPAFRLLVETLLPASCRLCLHPLPAGGTRAGVCPTCWRSVATHGGPLCPRCGTPEVIEATTCLDCRSSAPPWHAAVSVGPYQGPLRELVLLLKNHACDELAVPLGELLVAAMRREGWSAPSAVTAVPTPWLRRLRRGYNQAELLSRQVAHRLNRPHRALLARRRGGTQRGLRRAARLALSSAVFCSTGPAAGTVLLVDDVVTTGATLEACTRILLRAGAEDVVVATLARAARPGAT
jgi:ComF family protein